METDDPRESIHAKDAKTSSAAARDLAKIGTWDDLETLVDKAISHKSSAVRLYTAAAASDILSRHRGLEGHESLSEAQRAQVVDWVRRTDPGKNPGLLMMLSAVPDQCSVDRLGRMLKDPRNGVRAGAAQALRRMVLSASARDARTVREAMPGWFDDPKMPPDVVLELIRLVGEVGWQDLRDHVRKAAGAGRPHVEASQEALERLVSRSDSDTWYGLWLSDGLDVLEVSESPRAASWRIVYDEEMAGPDGEAPTGLIDGRIVSDDVRYRLIWAPRQGEPGPFAAIQDDQTTWWRIDGKDLVKAVDDLWPDWQEADPDALRAVDNWLEAIDGPLAVRARGIVRWRAGDLDASLELLEQLAGHKRPRTDIFFWLGRVRADAGDTAGAKEALDAFLDKAGKRAALRKDAESLRAQLG